MYKLSKIKILHGMIITAIVGLSACTVDERIDDLVGGYEGAIINKVTGDTVFTEYDGAKLNLLDLNYGSVATPLKYKILPDGTYKNTKVFPSKYKVWIEGPYFQQDTIMGDIRSFKKMNIAVTPNIILKITNVEVEYGISAKVTFEYKVLDGMSLEQSIGIVYSRNKYPGQQNALDESSVAPTYKRIKEKLKDTQGTFTETINLTPNSTYYVRALGKTSTSNNYWNYSNQIVINTGNIDISSLPVDHKQGVTGSTSAILIWNFPPVIDKIHIKYKDGANNEVKKEFKATETAYVNNLAVNATTPVIVQLAYKGVLGPENTIEVTTKPLTDKFIPLQANRPSYVPLFNDVNFKYSFSRAFANKMGPVRDPGWVNNPGNYQYMDWWSTNIFNNGQQNLPTCQEVQDMTEMVLSGGIKTLVDIIHFPNMKTITFKKEAFSADAGDLIDARVNLKVLSELKYLQKIEVGAGVPFTESNFVDAGVDISVVQIVKN